MVTLSTQLISVIDGRSKLQLRYFGDDDFGIPWYWHGLGTIRIGFDPWSGRELCCIYDFEIVENYKYGMDTAKELYANTKQECYLSQYEYCKEALDNFLLEVSSVKSTKQRKNWEREKQLSMSEHTQNYVCSDLLNFLKGGDEEGMTSIIHIPNIRTYAILNKKEYGGFEPMDYCPFCGAKLPERLDGKLTEILQKEYGLNSWKDYKKAPHEFHTDEWWVKRGL